MSLRDTWKNTGTELGHAFKDLGKTLIKTAKEGVVKADNWANSEDASENKEGAAESGNEKECVKTIEADESESKEDIK